MTFFCDNGYAILEIQKECAWTVRDVGCQKSSLASKITQTDYPDLGAHECLERAVNASNVQCHENAGLRNQRSSFRECRDLSSKNRNTQVFLSRTYGTNVRHRHKDKRETNGSGIFVDTGLNPHLPPHSGPPKMSVRRWKAPRGRQGGAGEALALGGRQGAGPRSQTCFSLRATKPGVETPNRENLNLEPEKLKNPKTLNPKP